ncbi:hypothetical protein CSUI_000059 [Cystoisospora suis]|uniref:Uncharacterized protein n=1 Tax=Cystoisospora suis TaxID=483139 RepID=A0A2C6LIZ4_9APIC|nr:hypothetical protein CSUI_000059 [Cystoisospora suis]
MVQKRECHTEPRRHTKKCTKVVPSTRLTPCKTGASPRRELRFRDTVRVDRLRDPTFKPVGNSVEDPPISEDESELQLNAPSHGMAYSGATASEHPYKTAHSSASPCPTTEWQTVCQTVKKVVIAKCQREVAVPQPFPCLEQRAAKECAPGVRSGNEQVRFAKNGAEFAEPSRFSSPVWPPRVTPP